MTLAFVPGLHCVLIISQYDSKNLASVFNNVLCGTSPSALESIGQLGVAATTALNSRLDRLLIGKDNTRQHYERASRELFANQIHISAGESQIVDFLAIC